MRGWNRRALVGLISACVGVPTAYAHPGLDTQLDAIDGRIEASPDDAQLHLRRAQLLREFGHHRDALAELRVVTRLDPAGREVLLERALVHVALDHPRRAERDLDRYLETGPDDAVALAQRAALRSADQRLGPALRDIDAAIALGGTPNLYLERGRLQEQLGMLDAAARGYRQGLDVLGPAIVLQLALVDVELRRGVPQLALPIVDAMLVSSIRADWILLRADVLDAMGHFATASVERVWAYVVADDAIRQRATPLNRLVRARVHLALGRVDLARIELDLVLKRAPMLPAALAFRDRLAAASEAP